VSGRAGAVAFVLPAVLALLRPAAGQEGAASPRLSFGSEVRAVRLDVTVAERDGRFVTDLGESDFEVLEDGQRQTPTSFVRRELPVSLVLLLDASDSITDRLPLAQAAAAGFLDGLRPGDEASVTEFNDAVTLLQAPTPDRVALRRAVERISAGGTTALYNALYVTLEGLPSPRDDAELRRRAVVLLSDGEDTASLVWEEQVVELARRREAAIHVVDLRPDEDPSNHSARLLRVLAEESGGEVHRPASIHDLDAVYARIGQELRSQYTLGYVSSNPSHEGRWRRIDVRVRGRRDVRVRHRTGYYDGP
jgi:Ca-activated chloride channel family protein